MQVEVPKDQLFLGPYTHKHTQRCWDHVGWRLKHAAQAHMSLGSWHVLHRLGLGSRRGPHTNAARSLRASGRPLPLEPWFLHVDNWWSLLPSQSL